MCYSLFFFWETEKTMWFWHSVSPPFLCLTSSASVNCLSFSCLLILRTSKILRGFTSKSNHLPTPFPSLSLILCSLSFSLFLRIKGLTWTFLADNERRQSWSHDPPQKFPLLCCKHHPPWTHTQSSYPPPTHTHLHIFIHTNLCKPAPHFLNLNWKSGWIKNLFSIFTANEFEATFLKLSKHNYEKLKKRNGCAS